MGIGRDNVFSSFVLMFLTSQTLFASDSDVLVFVGMMIVGMLIDDDLPFLNVLLRLPAAVVELLELPILDSIKGFTLGVLGKGDITLLPPPPLAKLSKLSKGSLEKVVEREVAVKLNL